MAQVEPEPQASVEMTNAANAKDIDLTRDLDAARVAFETGDAAASKQAHQSRAAGGATKGLLAGASPEQHGGAGSEYIKSIVFGGLDGIITTFAVVAASYGAELDTKLVLLMGFASLIADGISMGFGDYLSSKAELDFTKKEKQREEWELKEYKEGEINEMVELYVAKGMSQDEAMQIMTIFARHEKMFVDLMMVEELGLMPPDPDDNPLMNGVVTFVSFIVFGSVPLWFYVGFYVGDYDNQTVMFIVAAFATALAMFALGAVKAGFTHQNAFKSGFFMLVNGLLAALAAFFTGWGLEAALGL